MMLIYGGSVGATVCQRELDGEGGDAKLLGGVSPQGGQADHWDDGNTWGGRVVGISPGGGGTGRCGNNPHNEVH